MTSLPVHVLSLEELLVSTLSATIRRDAGHYESLKLLISLVGHSVFELPTREFWNKTNIQSCTLYLVFDV